MAYYCDECGDPLPDGYFMCATCLCLEWFSTLNRPQLLDRLLQLFGFSSRPHKPGV